jgi:hypothetical protein
MGVKKTKNILIYFEENVTKETSFLFQEEPNYFEIMEKCYELLDKKAGSLAAKTNNLKI